MDSKTQYRTALFESAAAVGTAVITTLVTVGLGLYFLARGAAAGDVAALMVWQLVLLVGGFGAVLFMVVVIGNVLAKLTKARGKAAQADNDALAAALAPPPGTVTSWSWRRIRTGASRLMRLGVPVMKRSATRSASSTTGC